MMEITLCRHCYKPTYQCPGHDPGLVAELRAAERDQRQRACADCEQYSDRVRMTTKPDGRVICPSCQKAIESHARARAQQELFGQPNLF